MFRIYRIDNGNLFILNILAILAILLRFLDFL